MKTLTTFILAVAALCISSCGSAFADSGTATLFDSASFVAPSQEASRLNATEAKSLAQIRANPQHKAVRLLTVNRSSLDSGVITLVTPEGKPFQYIGSKVENRFKADNGPSSGTPVDKITYSWTGASKTGALVISWDGDSFYGNWKEDGKTYVIASIAGGRFGFVTETAQPIEYQDKNPPPSPYPIKSIPPSALSAR